MSDDFECLNPSAIGNPDEVPVVRVTNELADDIRANARVIKAHKEQTDELEGLPELAPGSKWHGHVVVDYLDDTCWADEDVLRLSGDTNAYLQDVRAVIARHDRGNCEYWRDRMKALAASLLSEADEMRNVKLPASQVAEAISRDAANRILAILDEVPG